MSHDKARGSVAALEMMLSPTAQQAHVTGESLLDALDAVFEADPGIDEFGVVMLSSDSQTCSNGEAGIDHTDRRTTAKVSARDAFVLPEPHKLGMASWCLRPLFQAAKTRFERLNSVASLSEVTAEQMRSATRALLLLHIEAVQSTNHVTSPSSKRCV